MRYLQELLGLRFEEIEDPQVWNKDIQMVCIFTLIVRTILLYFSSQIFLFYMQFSVKTPDIFSLFCSNSSVSKMQHHQKL